MSGRQRGRAMGALARVPAPASHQSGCEPCTLQAPVSQYVKLSAVWPAWALSGVCWYPESLPVGPTAWGPAPCRGHSLAVDAKPTGLARERQHRRGAGRCGACCAFSTAAEVVLRRPASTQHCKRA